MRGAERYDIDWFEGLRPAERAAPPDLWVEPEAAHEAFCVSPFPQICKAMILLVCSAACWVPLIALALWFAR